MHTVRSWFAGAATFVGVTAALAVDFALACPNCKDSLVQNDPAAMGIVQGYFWSIILMLSMPFLLLATLSFYFYLLVLRARKQAAAQGAVAEAPAIPTSSLPAWSPSLDR